MVANDVDFKRSNLLIHQTKRMCTANLIVTNHEGQQFPGCRLNKSRASEKGISENMPINQLAFDRVLCDVPCSGDGTLRKAPDIWRKWYFHLWQFTPFSNVMMHYVIWHWFLNFLFLLVLYRNSGMGNGLHSLQIILAMRGIFNLSYVSTNFHEIACRMIRLS